MLSCIASLSDVQVLPVLFKHMRDAAETIGAQSYVHENGFFKMVLAKSGGYALRLHHFCLESKDDIHSHRWNFVSSMLSGEYTHTLFDEVTPARDTDNSLYQKNLYSPTHNTDGSTTYNLVKQYDCDLKYISVRDFKKGNCYFMPFELKHAVVVKNPCLTLIITAISESPTCLLYRQRRFISPPVNKPVPLSRIQICERLGIIKELLRLVPLLYVDIPIK